VLSPPLPHAPVPTASDIAEETATMRFLLQLRPVEVIVTRPRRSPLQKAECAREV
jgi:hypothetical protein